MRFGNASLVVLTATMFVPMAMAQEAKFALTGENTSVEFVGTKPSGKHTGGFKKITGTATATGTDVTTLKIDVDIDMESLFSDDPKLTNHLKAPDFFGVKTHPKSKFVTTKIEKKDDGYIVTGDLTMVGKTKSVSFPAKVTLSGVGLEFTGTAMVDRTQWGMTYGKGMIDDVTPVTVKIKATN